MEIVGGRLEAIAFALSGLKAASAGAPAVGAIATMQLQKQIDVWLAANLLRKLANWKWICGPHNLFGEFS